MKIRLKNRSMGLDMGSKNLGVSVYAPKKDFIIATKMMESPLNELTGDGFQKGMKALISEFTKLIKTYKPKVVMAERFLTRGFGGSLIEKVGIMIGMFAAICRRYKIKFVLVVPSAWKNSLNRVIDKKLNDIYALFKKQIHMVDAVFMAYYVYNDGFEGMTFKKAARVLDKHFKKIGAR